MQLRQSVALELQVTHGETHGSHRRFVGFSQNWSGQFTKH